MFLFNKVKYPKNIAYNRALNYLYKLKQKSVLLSTTISTTTITTMFMIVIAVLAY